MTTVIEQRRAELLAAIQSNPELLPAWRTHPYPPSNLVAPAVYLDMPRLYIMEQWVTADWPIVAIVDSQDAQASDKECGGATSKEGVEGSRQRPRPMVVPRAGRQGKSDPDRKGPAPGER